MGRQAPLTRVILSGAEALRSGVEDPCSVHDLHASIRDRMGIDHEKLTYLFQGRKFRLTDVHGKVVKGIIS